MKKLVLRLLAIGFLLHASARPASAVYVLTVAQIDNNVVCNGSGTLNLGTLTLAGTTSVNTVIYPSAASAYVGALSSQASYYNGAITGPTSFGSGNYTFATSGTGAFAGIFGAANSNFGTGNRVFVPVGYVSGTFMAGTATYNNATFASLGFTAGTYVYTFPSGDTFTVTSAVPEPSTWAMLGVGAVGAGVVVLRRRQIIKG